MSAYIGSRPVIEYRLEKRHRYVIGRAESADCRIDHPDISRHHLQIDTNTRPWKITDLGSKNGTRLEGRPLESASLNRSQWITLAGIPMRIELLDTASADRWLASAETMRIAARRLEQSLDSHQEPSVLFENALAAFVELAECSHGALFLANQQGQPELVCCHGAESFEGSNSVIRQVMRTGHALVNSDISTLHAHADQQSVVAGGLRAMACLPLVLAGQVRGVLYADSRQPGKLFTELDFELLEGLAQQAVFIVALGQVSDEVARLQLQLPASPVAFESSQHLSRLLDRFMPAANIEPTPREKSD